MCLGSKVIQLIQVVKKSATSKFYSAIIDLCRVTKHTNKTTKLKQKILIKVIKTPSEGARVWIDIKSNYKRSASI